MTKTKYDITAIWAAWHDICTEGHLWSQKIQQLTKQMGVKSLNLKLVMLHFMIWLWAMHHSTHQLPSLHLFQVNYLYQPLSVDNNQNSAEGQSIYGCWTKQHTSPEILRECACQLWHPDEYIQPLTCSGFMFQINKSSSSLLQSPKAMAPINNMHYSSQTGYSSLCIQTKPINLGCHCSSYAERSLTTLTTERF